MAAPKKLVRYLVVGDDVRVVKKKPTSLPMNEVFYELAIEFPDGWGAGRSAGKIELDIPAPPQTPTVSGLLKPGKQKDDVE